MGEGLGVQELHRTSKPKEMNPARDAIEEANELMKGVSKEQAESLVKASGVDLEDLGRMARETSALIREMDEFVKG